VKLAREVLDYNADYRERHPQAVEVADFLDSRKQTLLARAVIEQAAEIEKLKAALREALDSWEGSAVRGGELMPYPRIAELRRLL
jgi:hypothetical protein